MDNEAVKQAEQKSCELGAGATALEAKWERERREDLWLLTVACASMHGTYEAPELAQFADRVLEEFESGSGRISRSVKHRISTHERAMGVCIQRRRANRVEICIRKQIPRTRLLPWCVRSLEQPRGFSRNAAWL